jgi:hypothetical protein
LIAEEAGGLPWKLKTLGVSKTPRVFLMYGYATAAWIMSSSLFILHRVFEAVERVERGEGRQEGVDGLSEALDGWVKRSRRGAWREAGAQ